MSKSQLHWTCPLIQNDTIWGPNKQKAKQRLPISALMFTFLTHPPVCKENAVSVSNMTSFCTKNLNSAAEEMASYLKALDVCFIPAFSGCYKIP